jgi:hypothetical protein
MKLPAGTSSVIVQAHALRFHDGDAALGTATLCTVSSPPEHVATLLLVSADVPTIAPHESATRQGACFASAPMHVVSIRPHMHRAGREFLSEQIAAGGARTTLVDVAPWNFDDQRTYAMDLDLAVGDGISSTCTWQNDGDTPVTPGLSSTNEMCHQWVVVWPESARWSGDCH